MSAVPPPVQDMSARELMQGAARQVVKWRRRRRWTMGASMALVFAPMLLSVLHVSPSPAATPWLIVLPLFAGMIGLLFGVLMRPLHRNPLNALFGSQDVQAIGPLAETMQMLLPEMSAQATPALLRLLPHVSEQNMPQLTSYQRTCLHRLLGGSGLPEDGPAAPLEDALNAVGVPLGPLKMFRGLAKGTLPFNPRLADAILYAYIYMGSAEDMRVARRLARPVLTPHLQSVAISGLQKTALEILPLLEERIQQEDVRAELLRGASAPDVRPEELVRAAHGGLPGKTDELLRAAVQVEAPTPCPDALPVLSVPISYHAQAEEDTQQTVIQTQIR